jgi:hypothetical protein
MGLFAGLIAFIIFCKFPKTCLFLGVVLMLLLGVAISAGDSHMRAAAQIEDNEATSN